MIKTDAMKIYQIKIGKIPNSSKTQFVEFPIHQMAFLPNSWFIKLISFFYQRSTQLFVKWLFFQKSINHPINNSSNGFYIAKQTQLQYPEGRAYPEVSNGFNQIISPQDYALIISLSLPWLGLEGWVRIGL